MDNRKFQSASSASPPAVEAAPSTGYPTDGNPSTATPATIPGARWFHQIGEELRNVIASAGLTPSDSDLTQLLNAIVTKGLQGCYFNIGTAAGTADAITSSYTPAITALANGMTLYVRAASANATTTPTFTPNSGTIAAKTIVKGADAALAAGDIAGGGHWIELQYDATLDKWVLLNPATAVAALGRFSTVRALTSATTLTAADAGSFISAGTGNYTITLPLVSSIPLGTMICVSATVANIIVSRQGTDQISTGNGAAVNSLPMNGGDTLYLVCGGGGLWAAFGGTSQIGYSSAFGVSASANGYQKLPTGMIIQWGTTTTSGSADITVTFPVAFPSACRSVTAVASNATTGNYTVCTASPGTTSFNLSSFVAGSGARTAQSVQWMAIGN